jgi:hypothetical protein
MNLLKYSKAFIFSKLRKIICFCFAANLFMQTARAQWVEVNSANGHFGEKSLKGYVVCLELDIKSVEKSWSRYMKSFGKFESSEKQSLEGYNLVLSSISSDAVDMYTKITVSPRCVQVFMGASRAGSMLELPEGQSENVKKMLYDFAVEQYRQDLINQISEAERVVSLAVKAHDKRANEGSSLKNKIVRNKKEKLRLLSDLDRNADDLKKLRQDSTQNQAEQETALEEISKVRKIAEEKKLKLGQVK